MVFDILNDHQIAQYLRRIGLSTPIEALRSAVESNPEESLRNLRILQQRHMAAIPFGNTGLHYSQHRTISLDPAVVFKKLVLDERDGYCMESTGLLNMVLRSLGYKLYATGARVSRHLDSGAKPDPREFLGFGHMVLIVTIDAVKYLVDVGFGAGNPTHPLPLEESTWKSLAHGEVRLVKDSLPHSSDKSNRFWIFEKRYTPDDIWRANYCFAEEEFFLEDFNVMNFNVSRNPASWFTQYIVCSKMLLTEDQSDIEGQLTLAKTQVKRRIRGRTEVVQVLKSEEERVDALARWFGIRLQDEEIRGIRGLCSELI